MINNIIQSSYPQALAKLIGIIKDIHYAEEFLQTAVEQALLNWPAKQPENPVAWLVKVAQNRYIDFYRRNQKQLQLEMLDEPHVLPDLSEEALLLSYNDDLLRLIFTCCHPALNQQTQISLALKHVLGLSVNQIANALVINKTTLEQRLLRAKKKISANNISYQIPAQKHWPQRLSAVLKTIYLLFNEGYFTTENNTLICHDLCREAIRLARLLHGCIKNDAEVIGLLALVLQQDARSPARTDAQGRMILLSDQNRRLWKQANIQEANILVEKALRIGKGTPYAIQAAIATLHNNAASEADTDWRQIYELYRVLISLEDNPVIKLNAAIALAKSGNMSRAIEEVIYLQKPLKNYRHFYTSLAGLYFEDKQFELAKQAYERALTLTQSDNEKNFIQSRLSDCNRLS
ncbi:RNA polymerase sigma factor [Aliikangiella coralliicola]|uniref:Sigma-70 family RNA polymerase sigma factor n=1 Tax=Aliikangiella coralliicola TaxID=2592383 RepID=A0A545UFB3_9GAMM|nr:sigma-70 family RNA polymerase sigma factor [Aliikangiella coralliicola]TQV88157.1 sigma-70 family RNA polymerase sigma factor [Aliikangiella coralliicola]